MVGGEGMLRYVQRGRDHQPLPGCSAWFSRLLQNRGIDTPEKARSFLSPSFDQLNDPFLFSDMHKVIAMITEALQLHTRICVYGDYDVDGVCASSIIYETLRSAGADVIVRIPTRAEGYGMNMDAMSSLYKEGIRLLITVDCGITNHQEVMHAQSLGIKVIVTDHHELPETPSPADAVLNPKLPGYPFPHLCGAGVALKVIQGMYWHQDWQAELQRHIDLAAIATIADMVMLTQENRSIVRLGLQQAARTCRAGLRELMKLSSVSDTITTEDVSFRIAPRINAGGRLEDARQCVTMLTEDSDEAIAIAQHLDTVNRQRQAEQAAMVTAAEAQLSQWDFHRHLVLFAHGQDWNRGIVGLTAGKLQERYHWPVIVFSDAEDGTSTGSCRSIEGVHIHAVLTDCARRWRESHGNELYERFGGHAMAAGLTIRTERIPDLLQLMDLSIRDLVPDLSCYIPSAEYDCDMSLSEVTLEAIDGLAALEPTGYGCPAPVFRCRDASVQQMRRVGSDGSHLKFSMMQDQTIRDGIGFGFGYMADEVCSSADLLFVPQKNEFRGKVSPQLQLKAIRGTALSAPAASPAITQALLQEIDLLLSNSNQIDTPVLPITNGLL